jgi:hypothetical protein
MADLPHDRQESEHKMWIAIQRGQCEEFEQLFRQLYGKTAIRTWKKAQYLAVMVKNDRVSVCKRFMRLFDVDPNEILVKAANTGALRIVRHLLTNYVAQLEMVGWSAMMFQAVEHCHHKLVELLLRANPKCVDNTAYLLWRSVGAVDGTGRAIGNATGSVSCRNATGTVFRYATRRNARMCTLVCLLRNKCDVNYGGHASHGFSILGQVVTRMTSSARVVRCLLQARADPNAQYKLDGIKCAILAHAVVRANVAAINLLIEFKADVDRAPERDKSLHKYQPRFGTPLEVAIRYNQRDPSPHRQYVVNILKGSVSQ